MNTTRTPAVGTAVSGLVGLAVAGAGRRLWEQRLRRKGVLSPLGPSTHSVPRHDLGGLGEWIEHWSPPRPATPVGRTAAAAWAAPLTVVGALLVASGGGRADWDDERGAWIAADIGGLSGRMLRLFGFDANTLGQMVIATGRPTSRLLDHEAGHVRQGERLGPLVLVLYTWFSARHGYRDNPLERAARRAARPAAG